MHFRTVFSDYIIIWGYGPQEVELLCQILLLFIHYFIHYSYIFLLSQIAESTFHSRSYTPNFYVFSLLLQRIFLKSNINPRALPSSRKNTNHNIVDDIQCYTLRIIFSPTNCNRHQMLWFAFKCIWLYKISFPSTGTSSLEV